MHRYDDRTGRIAEAVFAYMRERLALEPVPLDRSVPPDDLAARAPNMIGPAGHDPDHVLALYSEVLAPSVISCDSPRFLAFIPAAPTKAALLFDMIVSCASISGISWIEAAGAVHAENQVLRFLSDLAGLPAGAGGVFVSGGSAANLSALVVAREHARVRRVDDGRRRRRIAVSDQTHSSVANTMRIIDVDPLVVPSVDDSLTGAAFEAALETDGDPTSVCAVVATAGTTNAGLVDDLAGIAAVCHKHGIWMHVDAAYGGAALLAPSVRARFDGIEHADSLVIDPHKWLYAPFDCAALIYRDPAFARSVHMQDASYLDVIHDEGDGWNPSDYAYHLTRRARGLPLWFSLAVNGSDAYRDAIERVLATTRAAAERIRALPHLQLVREPELSVVLFRRSGWNAADYDSWTARLLDDQIAFVAASRWHGEAVARLAFLHPDTTLEIVDEILATTF
ncbi:MAG: pyridoxal phosphate-dependent decarboxylase family protein [Acidimicrobiia bacterium]